MDPIVIATGADAAAVLRTVQGALEGNGYSVAPAADGWSGRAEVGSAAARAVLGGFSRRMVVDYAVQQGAAPNTTQAIITPAVTGWSGGALGASKAKKELQGVHVAVHGALQAAGLLAG